VGGAIWIVFDPYNVMRARFYAHEVDEANTPSMAATSGANGYATLVVSTAFLA
jgi:hypothetical protein